jgi:hypothetical protein
MNICVHIYTSSNLENFFHIECEKNSKIDIFTQNSRKINYSTTTHNGKNVFQPYILEFLVRIDLKTFSKFFMTILTLF